MIDLQLYKNEKQTQSAVEFIGAFVEIRKLYNEVKKIAECEDDRYTIEQKNEAQELIKGGFYKFVSVLISTRL